MSVEPQRPLLAFAIVLVTAVMLAGVFVGMVSRASAGPVTSSAPTCGQVAVPLGSALSFGALSGSGITSTGATTITGDLGVSPGTSVSGFPPATLTGTKYVADRTAVGAEANLTLAYNNASGRSNCAVSVAGNIGGQTLTPGLYKSTSSLAISSGDLTLNGGGNPNGVFVFQVASALTTTSGRAVVLTNGAQAGNVYWQIGSSASLGTTSIMKGTILAYASITLATGAHLEGRALARTGDVTLAGATIVVPTVGSSATYLATFTQTGLPSGATWTATLNGVQQASTSTTIVFTVGSGVYSYSVGAIAGYFASPSSGSLTVSSSSTNTAITFATNLRGDYSVIFTESGLSSGTTWSVTLNGVMQTSGTDTIGFTMPNGTNTYAVALSTGFTASPSTGSVTVTGADVARTIAFSPSTDSGATGGNGSASLYGLPSWDWFVIGGIIALGAAALVAGLVLSRRGKKGPQ